MSREAGQDHSEDPAGVGWGEGGSADLGHTRQDTEGLQTYRFSRRSTGLKTASCALALFPFFVEHLLNN